MSATTQPTAASPATVTAFVMKEGDKFVCVVDKERIGLSKHQDYFEYHLRRRDIKVLLEQGIEKIAYVGDDGAVEKIVDVHVAAPTAPAIPAVPAIPAQKPRAVKAAAAPASSCL